MPALSEKQADKAEVWKATFLLEFPISEHYDELYKYFYRVTHGNVLWLIFGLRGGISDTGFSFIPMLTYGEILHHVL